MRQDIIDRMGNAFEKLVPAVGKADTKAGEVIRALNRIGYRWLNDGDMVGIEYGNETCNPAARFLGTVVPDEVIPCINALWGTCWNDEKKYEELLEELIMKVMDWVEDEGFEDGPNEEDMPTYTLPEDIDYLREEEYEDEWSDEDGWEDDEDEYGC